jgi:hypothetical protein
MNANISHIQNGVGYHIDSFKCCQPVIKASIRLFLEVGEVLAYLTRSWLSHDTIPLEARQYALVSHTAHTPYQVIAFYLPCR